jgi:UDP-N-acetylmuramoyl-L-alanyl-D-glutamate--2,6-diaminopimelate ligase
MTPSSHRTIAELVRSIEPTQPRPLDGLLARLDAAGLVRGAIVRGVAASPAVLHTATVLGVAYDSRRVDVGGLFVAIPGTHADGHGFLPAAVERGARIAVVEHPVAGVPLDQIVVEDARRALAVAAAWWYADPSRELGIVGITGTDGKTTTSFLAAAALEAAGVAAGLIGTVETKIGRRREANADHVTTPQATELQATMRAMVAAGDRAAVVETTSHGLALHRVDEVAYDAAILTNVTHEHLELHGTFAAYRQAKLLLFQRLAHGGPAKSPAGRPWPRAGIVNHDDPSAALFETATREAGARLMTYGTSDDADVRAVAVEEGPRRLGIRVACDAWTGELDLRLAGRFNVHNALAVVALGASLGLDGDAVKAGLESVTAVPGRMERVDVGQPFGVVIDYAHSPASLEKVLAILGPVAAGRGGALIAVFGSAGERDRAKRPMMGRIAGERCRLVVVTDEDPRGEDPVAILDEIARGAEAVGRRRDADLLVIADRSAAIARAIERARPGDIVLLAGKGHERSIIYGSEHRPWDERAAALAALARRGFALDDGRRR